MGARWGVGYVDGDFIIKARFKMYNNHCTLPNVTLKRDLDLYEIKKKPSGSRRFSLNVCLLIKTLD